MIKKGILILLPFFVIALIIGIVSAFFPSDKVSHENEYKVTDYTINATVREDNSLLIDEVIDVHFNYSSHGIYRYIPLYQTVMFEQDGKTYKKNYKVEVIFNKNISDKCDFYLSGSNYIMQIGDPYSYAAENSTFHINYLIKLGDDKIKDFDQLYYNFIGTGWDTTISNVNINIQFEKPIEDRPITFYVGTDGEDEIYTKTIENSSVSFAYSNRIKPFQGITARASLSERYFKTEKKSLVPNIALLSCAVGLFVLALVIYIINKNKNRIVPIVEFTAPENITPSDAGYIIDAKVNNGDVSALVVYWASKGFVKIDESTGTTVLTKLKDADDTFKEYEKNIFNSMFVGDEGFIISQVNSATAKAISGARKSVKEENSKFFNKTVLSIKSFFAAAFMILIGVGLKVVSNITDTYISSIVCTSIAIICAAVVLGLMTIKDQKLTLSKKKYFWYQVPLFLILIGIYIPCVIFLFDTYTDPLLTSIFVPVFGLLSVLLIMNLNTRKEGKNKEVGRVFGLRTFILVTEQDRLKMLAEENPELFFDVLPYAYVLGISNVWIEKFKTIDVQSPDWYVSNNNIVDVYITAQILSSMNSMNSVVVRSIAQTTAKTASKIGKIFGGKGGGFSGGGFGGGGGGRW